MLVLSAYPLYPLIIELLSTRRSTCKDVIFYHIYNCRCRYIAGKAEDVFPSLRFHIPPGFDLLKSTVVGVLDPPRCGVHEKVVLGCRMVSSFPCLD